MASNTPNLNLLKKNPATDGNDTFNVQTMLNDNWDKIDTAVKQVKDKVDTINVPSASTTQAGIVQLTNATNSTSETLAPTAKALKTVSDAALPKTGGTVSGTLSISDPNTTPLMIHSPGSKRWVSHLESPISSSTTGGRLHLSPSKSVDATDWDFDKGIMINSDTGRVRIKNGVEGDFVTYNNRTWLNAQTNLGTTPSYTLTLGDSDTGFNWNGDGYFDIKSNGSTAAYVNNGKFIVRDDGNNYYDVGNDIRDLKSSGANAKTKLAAAVSAKSVTTTADATFDTIANNILQIKALTINGVPDVNSNNIGKDGNGNYLYQINNNASFDWTFTLPNVNFIPSYVSLGIGNIQCFYSDGRYNNVGLSYPPTNFISSSNSSSGISFSIVSLSKGALTLRVTDTSSSYTSFRFYLTNFTAVGI
ncbi:phage tail protein [Paenibacillus sp. WLX1005]|uniref:phage tail protein n=1 Tax=Paenibacillus sp. WLX1005 TaxID=3243766 RepID=UPI003983DB17